MQGHVKLSGIRYAISNVVLADELKAGWIRECVLIVSHLRYGTYVENLSRLVYCVNVYKGNE